MRQGYDDFRDKLDAARVWERRFAEWVRSRGWYVVPTYDFSGRGDDKAPKMLAPRRRESLVLPDLQCFRCGEGRWIECKWKSKTSWHRNSQRRTTGISLRLLRHYVRVGEVTGLPVVLAFVHEAEAEIRGGTLEQLSRIGGHVDTGSSMCVGGMQFWHYDEIQRWASIDVIPPAPPGENR